MAQTITLETISIGPAVTFRNNINNNFTLIANEFDKVYETMVDIELSTSQPSNQKNGDFWFKELS